MVAKYILKRVEGENVTFHEVEFEQAIQRFAKVISEGQVVFANKAVELGVLESTEVYEPTKEKKQEIGIFWEDWVEKHGDVKWCGEWNTGKTQRGVFGRITKSIAKLLEYVNAAHYNMGIKVEWSVLSKKDKLPEGVELIKSLRGY